MVSIEIAGLNSTEAEAIAQAALGGNPSYNLSPWIMAAIIDCIMMGVVSQQFITWWSWTQNERKVVKYLVYWTMLNAVTVTAYLMYMTLFNFAQNFGKWRTFMEDHLICVIPFWDSLIGIPIQSFYVHRAYRLNNNNIFIPIIAGILMLGENVMATVILVIVSKLPSELQVGSINTEAVSWFSITVATDVFITLSMSYGLYRSRTGWSHTDTLVKKLMLLTVETQLAPTLICTGLLIEFEITPSGSLGIFFEACQSKFYVAGFLATLNSRIYLFNPDAKSRSSKDQMKTNMYANGTNKLHQATVNVQTGTYVESFQMSNTRGLDVKADGEAESVEDLDYTNNVSRKNLHAPSILP